MKSLFLALLLLAATAQTLTAQRSVHRKHKPKLFRSVDVEYWNTTDSIILGGTLTIPNQRGKRFPAVILISGSGAQDRDYTSFNNYKPFKEIAEYLSSRGIAVLRVDDRGAGKTSFKGPGYFSPQIKAKTNPLLNDLIQDVTFGLNYLKTRRDISNKHIGLLGHSLGGVVAPAVANHASVAFIISMAGPIVSNKEFIIRQVWDEFIADNVDSVSVLKYLEYVFYPLIDVAMTRPTGDSLKKISFNYVSKIRNNLDSITLQKVGLYGATDDNLKITLATMATEPSQSESLFLKPEKYWKNVDCPILALFAAKDRQVNAYMQAPVLLNILENSKLTNYQIIIISNLNHGFRKATTGSMSENKLLMSKISPTCLKVIYNWIKGLIGDINKVSPIR